MSRIGNRRKAVDLAWKREKELVLEGKGTRDWTEEQQRQIIEEGRATDESGRAFDGHHMKNVATYPEYQEDPNNIQFLSRSEHLDAHGGCTQNSTNGFYDYQTGKTIDFGDNPPTSCEVIDLSNPEYLPKVEAKVETEPKKEPEVNKKEVKDAETTSRKDSSAKKTVKQPVKPPKKKSFWEGTVDFGKSIVKVAGNFAAKHPIITTIGVAAGSYVIGKAVSGGKSSKGRSASSTSSKVNPYIHDYEDNYDEDYDLDEEIDDFDNERTSYSENDVPAHSQRYHTKEGVKWIDKEPYHRGGNIE